MTSIRRRLTVWYTVALGATLLAFGGTLYLQRESSAVDEVDQRLALEADLSAQWLTESYRVLGRITELDTLFRAPDNLKPRSRAAARDSLGYKGNLGAVPVMDPQVMAYFDGARDFLVVSDRQGNVLVMSAQAQVLPVNSIERLRQKLKPMPIERQVETFTFDDSIGAARYVVLPVRGAGPQIGGILVAAPKHSVVFGPAALLRSMLLITPLIIVGSLGLGYWLAGTSLRPIEAMIDELGAITDGRSLHRRLQVAGGEELARLATTLNRMISRLEESFTALRRFTADASHELKTPLMVLRAGVERALTHPKAPPETYELLDQTLEGVNRMTELVDNLLTLARADEGSAPLAVAECDLRDLVTDAAETAGMLAEPKDITITTQVPSQPVLVHIDESRILQLLLNLVTNAVKYTPSRGQVSIGLVDDGSDVVIMVQDTGVGIAAGDLPHIFERFWRADVARTRVSERAGTGLGLAITQWIAEAHGGSIAVQSRPGRGTVFTVSLPRKHAPSPIVS